MASGVASMTAWRMSDAFGIVCIAEQASYSARGGVRPWWCPPSGGQSANGRHDAGHHAIAFREVERIDAGRYRAQLPIELILEQSLGPVQSRLHRFLVD